MVVRRLTGSTLDFYWRRRRNRRERDYLGASRRFFSDAHGFTAAAGKTRQMPSGDRTPTRPKLFLYSGGQRFDFSIG